MAQYIRSVQLEDGSIVPYEQRDLIPGGVWTPYSYGDTTEAGSVDRVKEVAYDRVVQPIIDSWDVLTDDQLTDADAWLLAGIPFGGGVGRAISSPRGGFDPNQANMFIGERLADSSGRKRLDKAADMESEGKTPSEIWIETGAFRGPDRQWRYEISDEAAELVTNPLSTRLPAHLKHPELYNVDAMTGVRAYANEDPYLAQHSLGSGGAWGIFSPDKMRLDYSTDLPRGFDPLDVVLHETQHAVDRKSGLQSGANPDEFMNPSLDLFDTALRAYRTGEQYSGFYGPVLSRTVPRDIDDADLNEIVQNVRMNLAHPTYEAVIGEIVARDTPNRKRFTPKERELIEPDLMRRMEQERLGLVGRQPVVIPRMASSNDYSVLSYLSQKYPTFASGVERVLQDLGVPSEQQMGMEDLLMERGIFP